MEPDANREGKMNKFTSILFIVIIAPLMLWAEFETMWRHQAQAESDACFKAVTPVPVNMIICVGAYCSSGSIFPSGYVALYDYSGNMLGAEVAEHDGWSELVAVVPVPNSSSGDYFTIGTCYDPDKGMQTWVAKWGCGTAMYWEHLYGGIGEDFGYSIVALDDGSCLALSSVTDGLEGFHDVELMKLSSEGDSLWSVRYGYETNDEGKEIIAAGDGTYYITGASSQFDSVRNSQLWVLHVDAEGNVLHEAATAIIGSGATDYDAGFGVVRHDDGTLTAVGIAAAESQERMDAALVKLDSELDVLDAENYEMQGFYDFAYDVIATDGSGDVILCGCSRNFSNQRNSGYLLRADANLDELWRTYYSGDFATGLMDMCWIHDNEFICVGYADTEDGIQQSLIMRIRDRFTITDFEIDPTTGHAPLTVDFENFSRSCPAYDLIQWDIDHDGVWDQTDDAFEYLFDTPGTYTIDVRLSGTEIDTTIAAVETIRVFDGDSGVMFTGNGSRVQIDPTENINLTSDFTFEAWINPVCWNNSNVMGDVLFCKGGNMIAIGSNPNIPAENALLVTLRTADGTSCVGMTASNTISLNGWQNIAVAYSSEHGAIAVIDGTQREITWIDEPTGELQDNVNLALTLGAHNAGFSMFKGIMDEARLWNIARSAEEIAETMQEPLQGFETGLVAYWRMNEASGNILTDAGLFNHHGYLSGTQWWQGCNYTPTDTDDGETIPEPHTAGIVAVYPNPFNPSTTVSFSIDQPSMVDISIYNIRGQKVKSLLHERKSAGLHHVRWNGVNSCEIPCASGIYLVRLTTGKVVRSSKILMLK